MAGIAIEVSIDAISPNPRQPRKTFAKDALDELAESINQVGVLQPLVVRPLAAGRYELIAGERRLRAARIAGLAVVPVIVRRADRRASLEMALIENVQREDVSCLECALAYRRLMDEFGLTQEQVAQKVGRSRAAVANTVRLLRLPQRVQEGLQSGAITESHGRAILALAGESRQLAAYDRILSQRMNVRDAEALSAPKESPRGYDAELGALEEALAETLGAPVRLTRRGKGGKLQVEFFDDEDLERLLEAFGVRL